MDFKYKYLKYKKKYLVLKSKVKESEGGNYIIDNKMNLSVKQKGSGYSEYFSDLYKRFQQREELKEKIIDDLSDRQNPLYSQNSYWYGRLFKNDPNLEELKKRLVEYYNVKKAQQGLLTSARMN